MTADFIGARQSGHRVNIMLRNLLATTLVLLMAALFATPVQAAEPAAAEEVAVLGSCSATVVGAAACTFSCTEGNTIVATFFGSGSVVATCGGGASACARTSSLNCANAGTKAVVSSNAGVCSATGIGFFSCGG